VCIHAQQAKKLNKFGVVDWLMPASVVRFFLNTFTALETDWGMNLSWMGLDNVPYQPASATVTCIHRFGLEEAFATFPTTQPTPLMLTVGLITEKPWIVNGSVVPRKVATLCFTVDNRVMDGKLGGRLMKATAKHIESFVNSKNDVVDASSSKIPKAKL